MKIADLVDKMAVDHHFTLTMGRGDDFMVDYTVITLSCSCGWLTHRAVHPMEAVLSASTILTQEWTDRERLHHLLAQELDPATMEIAEEVAS